MDKEHPTTFWKKFHINRDEKGITKISWGEANSEDRVLQTEHQIHVQHQDSTTGEWHTVYRKAKIAPGDYQILFGYVVALKEYVVVLSFRRGSGGYLTYTILGNQNGTIVELANKEDIYKGDIFWENGKLLEKGDSRYREWIMQNGRLTLIPYIIPNIPRALRIEYEIGKDGRVKIAKNHYSVQVGTIVQLIRTDLNPNIETGFINAGEGDLNLIKYLPAYKEAFKIVKSGKVEVKILPDLDWDKAFTITIEAI